MIKSNLSQMVDCDVEEIKIGLKVKAIIRKLYVARNTNMHITAISLNLHMRNDRKVWRGSHE